MYPKYVIYIALRMYATRNVYNQKIEHIINILNIAKSTLYEWIKLYSHDPNYTDNKYKDIKRKQIQQAIRKTKINDNYKQYIIDYMALNPTFNMKKLRKKIFEIYFINISKSTIYRLFKTHNLTYKSVQTNKYNKTEDQFEQEKQKLQKQVNFVRKNIISLDETSVELGLRQTKGWSYKGDRCIRKSIIKRQRYSLCLAINKTKIINYQLVKGSFNGESFKTFMVDKIIPKSKKASILMDNARIHHYKKFVESMKDNNINIIYNIPYSPQFNPIEYVFNVFKSEIRNNNIDTYKQLQIFVNSFIKKMNKNKFHNYFQKSYTDLFT